MTKRIDIWLLSGKPGTTLRRLWVTRQSHRFDLAALWYLFDTPILPSRVQFAVLAELLDTTLAQLGFSDA